MNKIIMMILILLLLYLQPVYASFMMKTLSSHETNAVKIVCKPGYFNIKGFLIGYSQKSTCQDKNATFGLTIYALITAILVIVNIIFVEMLSRRGRNNNVNYTILILGLLLFITNFLITVTLFRKIHKKAQSIFINLVKKNPYAKKKIWKEVDK